MIVLLNVISQYWFVMVHENGIAEIQDSKKPRHNIHYNSLKIQEIPEFGSFVNIYAAWYRVVCIAYYLVGKSEQQLTRTAIN